jgi:hypothetical protein
LFCLHASPQNEAIPLYTIGGNPTNSNVVGYSEYGAGFSFSPNVSIAVTGLGFGGSDLANSPYTVSLFNATGNLLASVQVTTGSTFYNQTYYQSIPSLDLTAGDTYYLGAEESSGGGGPLPNYWVGDVTGGSLGGAFSVNPDITYLNSELGFMPPGTFPGTPQGSSYFFVDENFEFTVVPEPSVFGLLAVGATALLACRRRHLAE